MSGVEGAGGPSILQQLLNEAMKPVPETDGRRPGRASERGAGMAGAMAMRRETLSEAIRDKGFVDIRGASVARMRAFVNHGSSEPEEPEVDLDSRTAWELASHAGAEVTGDVNLVLRILARIDPEWVAMLLK